MNPFRNQIGLFLRTFLAYPAAGAAAMWFGPIEFDQATGILTVDVSAATIAIAGAIWAAGAGGTFAWSRWAKALGGAT